jgi:two-component system, OmpR family, KDP operon response regulator KdpE
MKKKCILVVDDEVSILRYVSARLRKEGYDIVTASNGEEGLRKAEEENPVLVILDIMMPKMDGFEVCSRLREWSEVPIIMLSAKGEENYKVKCLNLGADDYITKPFGTEELLARVGAVLRRTEATNAAPDRPPFTSGDLKVSFAQRQVMVSGSEVKLTPTEFSLLQELVLNAGKVLTHTQLLQKVWGPEYRDEKEYLHEFVRRLRKKLEADRENPKYILSIAGVGYQFKGDATSSQ